MTEVLAELAQATPEWLTGVLQRSGHLDSGRVIRVEQRPVNASSQVAHLQVQYSAAAAESAPERLVLKIADPELERRMPRRNEREIQFYRAAVTTGLELPIVHCYDAAYLHGEPDQFHLLLADPSETTHMAHPHSVVPPTMGECERIVDTLARVHARCWDQPFIGAGLDEPHPAEAHPGHVSEWLVSWTSETVPRFLSDLAERLTEERRRLYREVGSALPARLLERQADQKNLTLTHGDVRVGNILYPRDPGAHELFVIDWKRAAVGIGAGDLAYMMALHWFPQVRARWERALLERYYGSLCRHGVEGYRWADLWEEYRLCVLR